MKYDQFLKGIVGISSPLLENEEINTEDAIRALASYIFTERLKGDLYFAVQDSTGIFTENTFEQFSEAFLDVIKEHVVLNAREIAQAVKEKLDIDHEIQCVAKNKEFSK